MSAAERLEELRAAIRAESISYGEIAELESLAEHIDPDDVELLQWAGVPEYDEEGRLHGMRMHRKVAANVGDGEAALTAYRGHLLIDGRQPDPDDEGAAVDLITAVLHYLDHRASVLPSDMSALVDRALRQYEHESDPENCMEEV